MGSLASLLASLDDEGLEVSPVVEELSDLSSVKDVPPSDDALSLCEFAELFSPSDFSPVGPHLRQ